VKRYLARALREAAERMGTTPKKLKRKLASLPAEQRAQYAAAKLRRIQQANSPPRKALDAIDAAEAARAAAEG